MKLRSSKGNNETITRSVSSGKQANVGRFGTRCGKGSDVVETQSSSPRLVSISEVSSLMHYRVPSCQALPRGHRWFSPVEWPARWIKFKQWRALGVWAPRRLVNHANSTDAARIAIRERNATHGSLTPTHTHNSLTQSLFTGLPSHAANGRVTMYCMLCVIFRVLTHS